MSINSSFGAKEGHINDTLGTLNFWGQRIGKTGPLTSSEMTENSQWNKHILVVGLIPAPSLRTLETASTMCAIKITMNRVQFSLINQKAVVWKVRILLDKHSRSWKPDAIFYEKKEWSKSCYIRIKMDKKILTTSFLKDPPFQVTTMPIFRLDSTSLMENTVLSTPNWTQKCQKRKTISASIMIMVKPAVHKTTPSALHIH